MKLNGESQERGLVLFSEQKENELIVEEGEKQTLYCGPL